ncbi:hypothetical protein [Lacipirellula sp.]|uniref:hypothetical protein n=1 Tax=Lacipirellula sp. TaxID=2691419 RepID=UPI003D12391E
MHLLLVAVAVALSAAGCGKSGPTLLPVKGKVTIDGQPAKEGGVTFHNAANQMIQLVSSIRSDGTYVMMHNRDEGAPAGDYVVTVLVSETPMTPDGNYSGLPKTVSNRKFADPGTTPLKVEVKVDAAPGAYDLGVTK